MDAYFVILVLLLAGLALLLVTRAPGSWGGARRLNSTADWMPASAREQEPQPAAPSVEQWCLRLITPHLEAGERLEGFARAFFSPPRPQDLGFSFDVPKCPLLIAVTSQRILLFELTLRFTVRGCCFIRHDDIRHLQAPAPGPLGTSGRMRLALRSGPEYQLGFSGPLLDDALMRQERRLAAYLRWLAPRFLPERPPHPLEPAPTR